MKKIISIAKFKPIILSVYTSGKAILYGVQTHVTNIRLCIYYYSKIILPRYDETP